MLKSISAALVAASIVAAPAFAAETKTDTKVPAAPVTQSVAPKSVDKALDSKASMDKSAATKPSEAKHGVTGKTEGKAESKTEGKTEGKATDTKAPVKHERHSHLMRHHAHKHRA